MGWVRDPWILSSKLSPCATGAMGNLGPYNIPQAHFVIIAMDNPTLIICGWAHAVPRLGARPAAHVLGCLGSTPWEEKPLTTQRCRETKKTKCENSENMWNCERKTFKSNCALTSPSVQSVWQSDAISPKPWKDENVAVRLASMEAVRDRDNLGTPVFFIESESWSSTSYARISLLVAEERHWHSGIPDGLH